MLSIVASFGHVADMCFATKSEIPLFEPIKKTVQTHQNIISILTEIDRLLAIPEQVYCFETLVYDLFIDQTSRGDYGKGYKYISSVLPSKSLRKG